MGHQDESILHQTDTEAVIDVRVAEKTEAAMAASSDHAAITDLASPSASYVQAEAVAARDKINEILDVLRDATLIP